MIGIAQRTPEWIQARKSCITASEAASVLGLNPYQSARVYYKNKINNVQIKVNKFMQIGIDREDYARDFFCKMYKLKVTEVGFLKHPKYDFLGASPDGLTSDNGLIEIKVPFKLKEDIPIHYLIQMQMQMEIWNKEFCYFFNFSMNKSFCTKVERSKQFFSKIFPDLKKFWHENILKQKQP